MLSRLTQQRFADLEQQWADQCAEFGEDYSNYARPFIAEAREICGEAPPTPTMASSLLPTGKGITWRLSS